MLTNDLFSRRALERVLTNNVALVKNYLTSIWKTNIYTYIHIHLYTCVYSHIYGPAQGELIHELINLI